MLYMFVMCMLVYLERQQMVHINTTPMYCAGLIIDNHILLLDRSDWSYTN